MAKRMKRLPESELEVMLALWAAQQPVSRSYFDETLKEKGWGITTINTYLSRLLEKGFIACERKGKTNFYTSIIPEDEYLKFEGKSFLNRFHGNSVKNFVASLYGEENLDEKEINELQEYLDTLKKSGGRKE